MDISRSNVMRPANVLVVAAAIAMLGQLALGAWVLARGVEQNMPPRALAHATTELEKVTGGKVLEIRVADEKGAPAFEAALAKDNAIIYMRIAAVGDQVTHIKVSELPQWLLDYHLEAYMRSIDKADVPLADAIVKAEELAAAPAIGAGIAKPLSATNPMLAYYVETIKGNKRLVAAIDATSGAFIEHPESLFEPHTPVNLARRLAEAE